MKKLRLLLAVLAAVALSVNLEAFKIGTGSGRGEAPAPAPTPETRAPEATGPTSEELAELERQRAARLAEENAKEITTAAQAQDEYAKVYNELFSKEGDEAEAEAFSTKLADAGLALEPEEISTLYKDAAVNGFFLVEIMPIIEEQGLELPLSANDLYQVVLNYVTKNHPLKFEWDHASAAARENKTLPDQTQDKTPPSNAFITYSKDDASRLNQLRAIISPFDMGNVTNFDINKVKQEAGLLSRFVCATLMQRESDSNVGDRRQAVLTYLKAMDALFANMTPTQRSKYNSFDDMIMATTAQRRGIIQAYMDQLRKAGTDRHLTEEFEKRYLHYYAWEYLVGKGTGSGWFGSYPPYAWQFYWLTDDILTKSQIDVWYIISRAIIEYQNLVRN